MVVFQSLGQLTSEGPGPAGWQSPDPGVPLSDYLDGTSTVSLATLRDHPSVRRVVGFLARHVSTVPFHVYERVSDTDRKRVTDHPLAEVLSRPRPEMARRGTRPATAAVGSQKFFSDLMHDYGLHDRWLAVWTWEGSRLVLTRIPAKVTKFESDGLGNVTRVLVYPGTNREVELPVDRCLLQHGYAQTGASGLSPILTLKNELDEAAEAVKYRRQMWRNSARVPQVITRPEKAKDWSPEARTRFVNGVNEYASNGAKAGRFLLLEEGMEMQAVQAFSPKDAQDIEGRKLADVIVAAAYYVPPELLGIREGTYSNIEAFRQMVYGDVCGPHFLMFEQAFNTQLTEKVAGGRPLYVEAAVEAKMRGSFLEQAKYGQTVVGAPTMTRNEWRARMNLPALEGGDELITPLNVVEGGQASPTDSAPDGTDPTE